MRHLFVFALLSAPILLGCDGGSGFTHATAPGQVSATLTASLGDDDAATTDYSRPRVHECHSGLVSLSIGPGDAGTRARPRLSSLYLKPPFGFDGTGTFPLRWQGGAWQSPWAFDGSVTPDDARGTAPFGMDPTGTVEGSVTVEKNELTGGRRVISGTVTANVAGGDALHTIRATARFTVEYQDTYGCP